MVEGCLSAQSKEHATLDLEVMSSSPILGIEITKKIKTLKIKIKNKRWWSRNFNPNLADPKAHHIPPVPQKT